MNVKRQSTEARTEKNEMLKTSDKDFKAAIIKMFQQAITTPLESNKK